MGTRGLLAFHVNGETKAQYSHSDSYPGWLGLQVLKFLRGGDHDFLKRAASDLKVVTSDTPPTTEQIEALKRYANRDVDNKQLDNWYVLLRETQGDPAAILSAGYIEGSFEFGGDSLFCEWGYVVDLDAENLDVYRGFNHGAVEGLWAEAPGRDGYKPITRVASFNLSELPADEVFLATFADEDD